MNAKKAVKGATAANGYQASVDADGRVTGAPQGHTPGPWSVDPTNELTVLRYTGDRSYRFIASTNSDLDTGRGPRDGDEENARLIAAAPELLAAVTRALEYLGRIEEGSEGAELRDALRAAVMKAGGI